MIRSYVATGAFWLGYMMFFAPGWAEGVRRQEEAASNPRWVICYGEGTAGIACFLVFLAIPMGLLFGWAKAGHRSPRRVLMVLLACLIGLYLSVASALLHPEVSGYVGLPGGTCFSPWPYALGALGGLLALAATLAQPLSPRRSIRPPLAIPTPEDPPSPMHAG